MAKADRDLEQRLDEISEALKSLDTKIRVIVQKVQLIEKNEKVLSKTLILHNQKLKELATSGGNGGVGIDSDELRELQRQISELKSALDGSTGKFATKEDLNELRYLYDMVNPTKLATIDQVNELIEAKLKQLNLIS